MANIIRNGGAANTTDWINPSLGLAQYWDAATVETKSIVTGNGFVGNAQRLESIINRTYYYFAILQRGTDFLTTPPSSGGYGLLTFKYRSSNPELGYFSVWGNFNGSYGLIGTFPNNTGNAISASIMFDWTLGALEDIVFGRWDTGSPMPYGTYYLELDEVSVIVDTVPIVTNESKIRVSSAWKDINFTSSKIRIGSAWKDVKGVQIMENGTWKTVI